MGTHSQIGCHRVRQSSTFFAEHGYLQTPSLVQWMATLRCGLSCAHCLAVSRESGFADMPLEKVRGLIDEVARMGVGEFLLTGGEPLVREDLGEVIEYLDRKEVSWTLNTAAMPDRGLREVITRHRPGFVAVSLDGPRPVHDAFRGKAGAWDEAMEAIRFFKSLEGVRVCAGTTVTSRNYDALDETFHIVTGSGADRWGIHLLAPEGRAAERPDLFLSKAQLKRLIKFVARRRRYFHVEMADEIGYLGYLEPLVRDVPLHCGAGRAQCVVLPDGEVVPCTTLDRSCSAGNVHERSLMQIWAEGFQDLRAWRPSGKCGRCDYAVGCRGGCWLQRKAGTQCFKEVWHVPGALKTAAGIAICLGGLAAPKDAGAAVTGAPSVSMGPPLNIYQITAAASITLDEAVMNFYVDQATGRTTDISTQPWLWPGVDWDEPAWQFFKDFKEGTLPRDISERCARVISVLESNERSLSLIALLWRAVEGPLFEADPTRRAYYGAERQAIRDAIAAIGNEANAWRLEIFIRDLDPYLSGGRRTDLPHSLMSKAGPRLGDRESYALSKDLNEERWGVGTDPDTQEAAVAYLFEHHYAEQMDLVVGFSKPGAFVRHIGGTSEVIGSPIGSDYAGPHRMGPFDVIVTPEEVKLSFSISGSLKTHSSGYTEESLLNDQGEEQDLKVVLQVSLAGGQECTYVELLNLIYEQQRLQLVSIAYDWLSSKTVPLWNQNVPVVAAVYENGALLWPALREIIESDSIIPTGRMADASRLTLSAAEIAEIHRRAVLKDIDFWMF